MLTNLRAVNPRPNLSKVQLLRFYLVIACAVEFCLYWLACGDLIILPFRFLGEGFDFSTLFFVFICSGIPPIFYIISFFLVWFKTTPTTPAEKWVIIFILLNVASYPAVSVAHLLQSVFGYWTPPHYFVKNLCDFYRYFLNLNLLSVIPIILVARHGMTRFNKILWMIVTIISLSPINYLTYSIMHTLFNSRKIAYKTAGSTSKPSSLSENSSTSTIDSRLTALNQLRDKGLITEEEYNEKKQNILSEL